MMKMAITKVTIMMKITIVTMPQQSAERLNDRQSLSAAAAAGLSD